MLRMVDNDIVFLLDDINTDVQQHLLILRCILQNFDDIGDHSA